MEWIFFLVIAYFLIALAALADKFVLTKALPEPVAYAVTVSTVGLVGLVLIPFGFVVPNLWQLFISLVAGFGYTLSIFCLYKAVKFSEVSRVYTLVGAITAISTFIFSYIFLAERLSFFQLVAFFILLFGGVLINLEFKKGKFLSRSFIFAILAGIIFGISYVASKYVYANQIFTSGFVWIRIFAFIGAMLFLVNRNNWHKVRQSFTATSPMRRRSSQLMLFAGQAVGGLGFLLLNYVISLSSVSITLAAQGLQYAFVLVLVLILAKRFPQIWQERFSPLILTQKIAAIFLIGAGLVLLTINQV